MLNVVTFAHGKLFGVDPGSVGYGAPLHHEWYRSTIAHDTVSADQQLQSNADGHGLEWSDAGGKTTWKAEAGVYPGITFRRQLILSGNTMTDHFLCESDDEHTYDWAFHSAGTLAVSVPTSPLANPLSDKNGYQHLSDLRQGMSSETWTAEWKQPSATLKLKITGQPGTTILTATGPGRNPADQTPLIIIRRRARKAVFDVEHVFTGATGS
jgi:hypothetical protein